VGDLLARELDHKTVFVVGVMPGTRHIFAGTLKQLSQQK
jgi:hypothetical protein